MEIEQVMDISSNESIPSVNISGQQSGVEKITTPTTFFHRGNARFHGLPPKGFLLCELVFTLGQVLSAIIVLVSSSGGHRDDKISTWLIGYTCGCIGLLPLLYRRYYNLGKDSTSAITTSDTTTIIGISTTRLKVIIADSLQVVLDCYFTTWLVVGTVLIFGVDNDMSKMYILCSLFLLTSCVGYVMPVIIFSSVCCVIPRLGSSKNPIQMSGATLEAINSLPTYVIKVRMDNNNAFGSLGIIDVRTGNEKSTLGDDSCCPICLSQYGNNDTLIEFPCCHLFHRECVDKWLNINATCPLCKAKVCETMWNSFSAATAIIRHSFM